MMPAIIKEVPNQRKIKNQPVPEKGPEPHNRIATWHRPHTLIVHQIYERINHMKNHTNHILTGFAALTLAFTAPRTFDLVAASVPPGTESWLPWVGVLLLDGGFLTLDWVVTRVPTRAQRYVIGALLLAWWLAICATNLADVMIHQSIQLQAQWPLYAINVASLLYLLGYVFYQLLDPSTQQRLVEQDANQIVLDEINASARSVTQNLAPYAGKALGLDRVRENFRRQTGRQIEEVLGANWAKNTTARTDLTLPPNPAPLPPNQVVTYAADTPLPPNLTNPTQRQQPGS